LFTLAGQLRTTDMGEVAATFFYGVDQKSLTIAAHVVHEEIIE